MIRNRHKSLLDLFIWPKIKLKSHYDLWPFLSKLKFEQPMTTNNCCVDVVVNSLCDQGLRFIFFFFCERREDNQKILQTDTVNVYVRPSWTYKFHRLLHLINSSGSIFTHSSVSRISFCRHISTSHKVELFSRISQESYSLHSHINKKLCIWWNEIG